MQQQSINKAQTSRFYLDVPSPLGTLRLESDGEALTALHFEDTKAVHTTTVAWHEAPQLPLFKEVQTWLARYFGGQDPGKRPPFGLREQRFSKPFGNNCWPYPTPKPLPTALWPHT
ncbi:hypothetical protein [Hoylesella shahii]|uniref:hypothetical protein n=1 Tax=Hoylesella shahii TaxID=228603 RepID=UPI0012EBEC1E